jgi:hypothetical protein
MPAVADPDLGIVQGRCVEGAHYATAAPNDW